MPYRYRGLKIFTPLCYVPRFSAVVTADFRYKVSALLESLRGHHGGYGKPVENLLDTYSAAIIIDCLTLDQTAGILEFTKLCSDAVFGFRLTPPGSANSLATTHAGIELFQLYGAVMPEEKTEVIRHYIASCQTGSGGFGRTPGAIATLEDT
jgi:prenyltransferase beta subunit